MRDVQENHFIYTRNNGSAILDISCDSRLGLYTAHCLISQTPSCVVTFWVLFLRSDSFSPTLLILCFTILVKKFSRVQDIMRKEKHYSTLK